MTDSKGQRGILTRAVLIQSTGYSAKAGQGITAADLPAGVWEKFVEEGIVKLYPDPDVENTPAAARIKRQQRKAKKVM